VVNFLPVISGNYVVYNIPDFVPIDKANDSLMRASISTEGAATKRKTPVYVTTPTGKAVIRYYA
jgi:hypothetical protein